MKGYHNILLLSKKTSAFQSQEIQLCLKEEKKSTVYLLISHATLPLISITSEEEQYPMRLRTLFLHFNSSI